MNKECIKPICRALYCIYCIHTYILSVLTINLIKVLFQFLLRQITLLNSQYHCHQYQCENCLFLSRTCTCIFQDKQIDYFIENGCFEGSSVPLPRRLNDLIISLLWVIVTCLPLFYYTGRIFWFGTYLQQAIFLAVTVFCEYNF